MAEEHNDNYEISDEMIRRFLLADLTAEERIIVEGRLFSDERLRERTRLAEFELADDYAFQRLNATERESFEKVFSVSKDRRELVNVSNALRDSKLLSTASPEAVSLGVSERLLRLFGFKQPLLGYAVGFAVLLLLAGIAWVVVVQRRSQQPAIARNEPTPIASPASIRQAESLTPSPSAQPSSKPSPASEVAPSVPVVATIMLSPGALRDAGDMPRISVPHLDRGTVRLHLILNVEEQGAYTAELLTAEGKHLFVDRKLKLTKTPTSFWVAFDLPGQLLTRNDYQVVLSRKAKGLTSVAGRYSFRIAQ